MLLWWVPLSCSSLGKLLPYVFCISLPAHCAFCCGMCLSQSDIMHLNSDTYFFRRLWGHVSRRELLYLPLMPIILPLSITALVNAMLPPAHRLVTKKMIINEVKPGKHPKLIHLLIFSTRKLFPLSALENKVCFKKSICISLTKCQLTSWQLFELYGYNSLSPQQPSKSKNNNTESRGCFLDQFLRPDLTSNGTRSSNRKQG